MDDEVVVLMADDYPHPTCDPDAISEIHSGDICPVCGDTLRYDDDDVRHLETGEEGTVLELAPTDVSEPLACPDCYREWLERNTHELDDYT